MLRETLGVRRGGRDPERGGRGPERGTGTQRERGMGTQRERGMGTQRKGLEVLARTSHHAVGSSEHPLLKLSSMPPQWS